VIFSLFFNPHGHIFYSLFIPQLVLMNFDYSSLFLSLPVSLSFLTFIFLPDKGDTLKCPRFSRAGHMGKKPGASS